MEKIFLKKKLPVEIESINKKYIVIENPDKVNIKASYIDTISKYQIFNKNRIIRLQNITSIILTSENDATIFIELK